MTTNRSRRGGVSRRTMLRKSLAAAGGMLAAPWIIPARALGRDGAVAPGERITLGVIGIGPRCQLVLGCMLAESDVQCVAVCDVQAGRRATAKAQVDSRYGNRDCAVYRDFRELLARPDIDAVLIATGDRWHAPASIMAARAGKDVYSEKPCGMTMAECRLVDETMRRYGRVYQAGTQRRSIGNFQKAAELAHNGLLGRLHTLHASIYRPWVRHDWLPAEPEPDREVVDWDLWLGPSPWRPYNHAYVAGGWRGHHDLSAGAELLDWGAHTVDLCQWANRADDTTPVEYVPGPDNITARYANGVTLVMDFLNTPFEDRSPHYITRLGTCPVRYEGDAGWVETGDNADLEVHPASLKGELRRMPRKLAGTAANSHVRNFFDCVRSRAQPAAHAGVMRRSHIACFAAVTAWQLNRAVRFDPVTEAFLDDPEADRLRARAMRAPWGV
jgi:hypothetical protein